MKKGRLYSAIALATLGSSSALGQWAFGIDDRDDLYRVNLTTGHASFITHEDVPILSIARNEATDKLYGVLPDGALYSIDEATGTPTFLGDSGNVQSPQGLAFAGEELWCSGSGGGELVRLDPLNGDILERITPNINIGGVTVLAINTAGTHAYMYGDLAGGGYYRTDFSGVLTQVFVLHEPLVGLFNTDGTFYQFIREGAYSRVDFGEPGFVPGPGGQVSNGQPGVHPWMDFTSANAVPEPGTLLALCIGSSVLLRRRNKRGCPF